MVLADYVCVVGFVRYFNRLSTSWTLILLSVQLLAFVPTSYRYTRSLMEWMGDGIRQTPINSTRALHG